MRDVRKLILAIVSILEIFVIIYLINKITNTTGYFIIFQNEPNLNVEENEDLLPKFSLQFIPSNNSILMYELMPNSSQYFDGYVVKLNMTKVKINSDGFRDVEHSIEKLSNVKRIVIIGDSNEFGWGVELEDSYPKVLERLLNINCNGSFEVISMAVPGYDLWQKLEILKIKGLKYNPDLIILGLGLDDLENSSLLLEKYKEVDKEIDKMNISEVRKKIIKTNKHLEIMKEEEEKVMKLSTQETLSLLSELKNLKRFLEKNTTIVLWDRIFTYPNFDYALREIAESEGWYFFASFEKCNGEFYDTGNIKNILNPQDPHPSKLGHKLLANILFCNIKKHLSIC